MPSARYEEYTLKIERSCAVIARGEGGKWLRARELLTWWFKTGFRRDQALDLPRALHSLIVYVLEHIH